MDTREPRDRGDASSLFRSTPGGVEPEEFAEYLRSERERRRITLEQIADETKIAPRHLRALERGDVKTWPGGMYRRAMMRAYADSIGIDREVALEQFDRIFEHHEAGTEPKQPAPQVPAAPAARRLAVPPRLPRRVMMGAAATAAVLVLTVMGWRALTGESNEPGPVVTAAEPAPEAAADAVPASAPVINRAETPAAVPAATTGSTTSAAADETAAAVPVRPRGPGDGRLVIVSEPAGARVTVNGIGWGETPLTIRHLPPGAKRVRFIKDGFASVERSVELTADGATVRATLKPQP